jgi:tetratricopeptide (TPR) repeat protein
LSKTHGDPLLGAPAAEDYLRLAMASESPRIARSHAVSGLKAIRQLTAQGEEADPESHLLLLRELFKATMREGHPRSAHAVARKMTRLGVLSEVAHADLGRACSGLQWFAQAAQAYRLAARYAPAARRSLHWSSCGLALWHCERHDEAVSALERAIRWSTTTRVLHQAQVAMVELSRGVFVDNLQALVTDLALSPQAEGYGRFVLGWVTQQLGDSNAHALLREFLRRNELDALRAATLRGEIAKAREILHESPQPVRRRWR